MATILPTPASVELLTLRSLPTSILAVVRPRSMTNPCPLCAVPSTRVHSRYQRTLLDLPWSGVTMRLELHVRRYFCDTATCPRKIFTERLPDLVAPSARRTKRLDTWFTLVGFALGGEAGARLLRDLGATSSPDTLLRHIRAVPVHPPAPGMVIGIDEFGFRRGKRFATIIVDLTTHQVLDLLPDVQTTTVVTWLQQHPHIQVVSRDRGKNFGEAIRQGAPQAYQVADRWHLCKNLGERVEGVLREHKAALTTPRTALLDQHASTLGRTKTQQAKGQDEQSRQLALFHQVHAAKERGLSGHAIAKLLRISAGTACKYAQMSCPPDRRSWPSGVLKPVAPYVAYIHQRWNDGCRNGAQIYEE